MVVELSTDGATFEDYSDQVSVLEPPTQRRATSEIAVMGYDAKVPLVGKRLPYEVKFAGPYLDGTATTNAFAVLYQQWTTNRTMHIRWTPNNDDPDPRTWGTGDSTADYGELISLTWPGGDAASGEPVRYEAIIRAGEVIMIN